MTDFWTNFKNGNWTQEIDVQNFIQKNYTLYEGTDDFLANPTEKTKKVWNKAYSLILEELKKRDNGCGN